MFFLNDNLKISTPLEGDLKHDDAEKKKPDQNTSLPKFEN